MAKGEKIRRTSLARLGWEFFGSELRRHRDAAGISQTELGNRVYCSGSYIDQFEAAIRKPQLDLAERIDVELKTGGLFGRMCRELIDGSPYDDYFTSVAELQALSETISAYGAMLVPGLLQTEGYTRALYRSAQPFLSPEGTAELVRLRLERGKLLKTEAGPHLWIILDEMVLRRPVGGSAAMVEQLTHITNLTQSHRVLVQVLPYSAGAHALLAGSMTLMTFTDAPSVAYVEAPYTGELLDDPAMVARCQKAYDLARAAALPPEASLAMIHSAAKEYRDDT